MAKLTVKSFAHPYDIHVGENLRFKIKDYLKKEYSSILIVTDENVAPLYLNDVKQSLSNKHIYEVTIPSGEQSKSFESYIELQTKAIEFRLDRQSLIIALGGGVVGDLAGFVAATYMRGIDYIQVPTTILAHDSSVGGKVAINHELGKNLIGSFYPPKAVIYDVHTLSSLSNREVRSGYAELMKEALIADEDFFKKLLKTNVSTVTNEQLKSDLLLGIRIKAAIVQSDEKESGDRKFLNLGHTLAHAIESELGYGLITHGEAVAIGLLFALHVSEQTFNISLPYRDLFDWLKMNQYPLKMHDLTVPSLINRMKLDKKSVDNHVQMVLLKNNTNPTVVEINDHNLQQFLNTFLRKLVER